MNSLDILYSMNDQQPALRSATPYWIIGVVVLIVGFFVVGVLAWVLKGVGVFVILVGTAYYFGRGQNEVILTNEHLILKTKAGEKQLQLTELKKVELNFVENGRVQRKAFFGLDNYVIDEKTVLSLSDGANKQYEVAAQYFDKEDFTTFLRIFQIEGQGYLLQENDRIKQLLKENETYLNKCKKEQAQLTQALVEAYKNVYVQRGDYYLKENPNANILYTDARNPNYKVYFIENDYLPALQGADLEKSLSLLKQAEENIALAKIQLTSFEEIAQKLQKRLQKNEAEQKARKARGKIEELSIKNELSGLNSSDKRELELQIATLDELQKVALELNGITDLDRAAYLKKQASELLAKQV
jgi:hypothetical protein